MKPVAIIGMASIFPKAENLTRFWENILNEVNCIEEVPSSRWSVADYYDPDPGKPDKTYSKHGGFIPDTIFDPMEFGLPPNILEVTDVSQLLSLIVARDALADAGHAAAEAHLLDRTGVILGMVGMSSKVIQPLLNRLQYPVWEKVLRASQVPEENIPAIIEKMKLAYISWNENAFPGAIGNVVAGRIANRLDLGGVNCIVDAACGSSLAAVSMAVNELETGHADMMITGGVDTDNSILTYLCFSKTPAFSKGDRLRAFSADSDGMLAGEGIGMLVLKRLEDAERNGDRVYAVIRGIGTSSDGHYKSIYAPRSGGQAKALRRAYQEAGYPPGSVGLIEAHGTGTNAGDPAEFEGLREVFSEKNPRKQHIALGSVKSQIGHTKATAGAASMIKAALALHHHVLPATINVSRPHPDFEIENTPFYISAETRPWFRSPQENPRRAGVSSFGFGGTNFHIALEEYGKGRDAHRRIHHAARAVLLSAENSAQLKDKCLSTQEALQREDAEQILSQLDEEASQVVVPHDHARVGFVAESVADARNLLGECHRMFTEKPDESAWTHPKGIYYRSGGMDINGKTVALFPGQGSQYLNMGRELAIHNPSFRQAFEKADEVALSRGREKLTQVVYPNPVFSEDARKEQQAALTRTENAQPAIGTMSMSLFGLLRAAGLQADFFAGHSFGELTALWAAGAMDDESFLNLAQARGEAMGLRPEGNQESGSMMAVKGDVEKVRDILSSHKEITIANHNSPSQVVFAGAGDDLQSIKPKLEEAGLSVISLPVSAAFHTSFVRHAQKPFEKAIRKEKFSEPNSVVYANASALPYERDPQKISQTLAVHMLSPVRFQEEIEHIYQEGGKVFIEFGPKSVLTNLVKEILRDQPHEAIALNPNTGGNSDTQFRQAIMHLRVLGYQLGDTDPLRRLEPELKPQPSKVSVVLNGGLFITEKTRADFENALHEHLPIAAGPAEEPTPKKLPDDQTQTFPVGDPAPRIGVSASDGELRIASNQKKEPGFMNDNVLFLVKQFQEHQQHLLQSHQQFLKNDQSARNIIQEIIQSELSAIARLNGNPPTAALDELLANLSRSAEVVSGQHGGTSEAHQEYIKSQTEFSKEYARLIRELFGSKDDDGDAIGLPSQPSVTENAVSLAVRPAEVPEPAVGTEIKRSVEQTATVDMPSFQDDEDLTGSFLRIVSEKTGYPVEMLELGMDMEADLGIDSIKRVEILSAMQEQYPHLPTIDAEELAALRTLQQIIATFGTTSAKPTVPAKDSPVSPTESPTVGPALTPKTNSNIEQAFLAVVSEKTGYPVDMLETGMDMEADLGIDSIKRVEILSAMQDQFPDLPSIEAEEMTELRTLEQIISSFNKVPAKNAVSQEKIKLSENKAENSPAHLPDGGEIQAAFLAVVSEKTGYPVDMLETGMDMEADLGIDSIKRVEILSAMQDQFPHIPAIEAEELALMRTLGDIITKFSQPSSQPAAHDSLIRMEEQKSDEQGNSTRIRVLPVKVERLPDPDWLEFDIPDDHLILITDDGAGKSRQLAEVLQSQGKSVGLIHFGQQKSGNAKDTAATAIHFEIKSADGDEVQRAMEDIIASHEKIAAFVHVHPPAKKSKKGLLQVPEDEESILKTVFLMARHLKKPLLAAGGACRPAFLTLSFMDGNFGLNGYDALSPIAGGLSGLTKSLRLEWPEIFCRALDFHPALDVNLIAKKTLTEWHDPDIGLSEVGYTPEGRFSLTLDDSDKGD